MLYHTLHPTCFYIFKDFINEHQNHIDTVTTNFPPCSRLYKYCVCVCVSIVLMSLVRGVGASVDVNFWP